MKTSVHRFEIVISAALGVFVSALPASSVVLDLTCANCSGTINGAIYQQWDGQPTGTGVFNTFVEIGQPGENVDVEDAYNTTVDNVLDNGSADQHNYSITLGDLPTTNYNSVDYAAFFLDINEDPRDPVDTYLSLDEVQIFVGGTPNASSGTFTGGILDHDGTLVYRMDGLEDSWVALGYSLNNGSSPADMLLYIEMSLNSTLSAELV